MNFRIVFSILFLTGLLFFQSVSAQNISRIDSIRTALKSRPVDTVYVKLTCDLAWELRQEKPEEAMINAKKAFDLSNKLNFVRGKAKSLRLIGIIDRIIGDNSAAIISIKAAIHIYDSIKDLKGLGESYNSLGEVYRYTADYAVALTNYQSSLDIFQKLGDKRNIALAENNIGIIYYNQEKFEKALTQYQESLKLRQEIGDMKGIGISYTNIANVYGRMQDYDKSLTYQKQSLEISRKMKNAQGMAIALENIGELHSLKKETELGLNYYDSAYVICSQIKDSALIVDILIKIGQNNTVLKKYDLAKTNLDLGLSMATRQGLKQQRYFALSGLSDLYEAEKNYPLAFANVKMLLSLSDTLTNEAKMKQLNELETRYETKQKEQEIEMLSQKNHVQELQAQKTQEEIKRGRVITYSSLLGGLLVIILLFLLYSRYRLKQKANVDLERKNLIIEEKNKNITDSINYAQRIQKALLASENLLEKNLPEYFVLYQPKDIVSGDFYWAADKNEKFFIAACDCTGHGVPGAFMSLLNSTYLNEAVIEKSITDPAAIFGEVRKQLIAALNREGSKSETRDGMDATLVAFDKKSNSISFACANNPLLLIRKGELLSFGPDKFPVGMHPDHEKKTFSLHQLDLQKGDMIYLLTDGFGDQFGGPEGKKFKIKKLKELLLEIHKLPLEKQCEILGKNHGDWKGELEQVDDVLVIGIRI